MVHTAHTKQGDCSQMAPSIKHISKVAVEVLVHTATPCFGSFLFQLQMSTRTMECLRGTSTSATVLRVNNTTTLERREHSLPKMASQTEVTWAGTSCDVRYRKWPPSQKTTRENNHWEVYIGSTEYYTFDVLDLLLLLNLYESCWQRSSSATNTNRKEKRR